MMDEETDDELPSISLSQDSSTREVVMPSAREVAAQRAREKRTELELQRLRAQHSPPPVGIGADVGAPPPPRSDSSGSEGEAALAAAVRALRMPPATPPARSAHASVARRLLALLPALPHTLQQFAAAFADNASTTILRKLINRMVHAMGCALSCEYNAWTEEALVACGGALAAACLAAPAPRPAPRRALHRALATAAPHAGVVRTLAHLVTKAATFEGNKGGAVSAARALLALSDCARGGPPLADLFAALLVRRALVLLLAPYDTDEASEPLTAGELHELLSSGSVGWRGLSPAGRHTALRLVARALAGPAGGAGDAAARARVVAALAQPPQTADKQHPDYLKVAVAASTLQLLFRAPHA